MRRIKLISAVMAVAMLMPVLTSCKSGKKGKNVVKADDPWYESSRFELSQDLGQNDSIGASYLLGASNDKVFYLYCFSTDAWNSSKTVIDTYDFDGNMVNRTYVSYPSGIMVGQIYIFHADPEGKTIYAIGDVWSGDIQGPAFIDIDIETGKVTNLKEFFNIRTKSLMKDTPAFYVFSCAGAYTLSILRLGRERYQLFLYKDSEFICELDCSTLKIREFYEGFSVDESTNTLYAAGLENIDNVSVEFDLQTGALKSKKSFAEMVDTEVNFSEYSATADGDMCKMDSLRNIMKIDISTMTPETVIDNSWYNPLISQVTTGEAEFGDDHFFNSDILSCNDERTIIHEMDIKFYGTDDYSRRDYITVISKADKNPNAGKKIIELALPPNSGMSEYLSKSIYEFNKTDDEYIIRIWSKYNTGFTVGRTLAAVSEDDQKTYEMIRDIRGDDAPDLVISIQQNYAMRDDVFMDLTGFLDQEVLDKQYGNIIEAGRIEGKLYFLPVTLEIEGLVTNVDIIKEGAVGITFDEYDQLIKDHMYGYSPYDYPCSTSYNRNSFILSCIDIKSAIEGESVNFGTDQFRTVIEYAKDKFKYEDETSAPQEYILDFNRNRGECYYKKMGSYLDFVRACFRSNGNYRIIGTPSVDASGPRFKALETISVSANTDIEEGCKKFINYLFSGVAFESVECDFWEIVTNKEIMVRNIDDLTIHNNDAYEALVLAKRSGAIMQTGGAEKAFGDKTATDEMRESFLNSMSTISTYYYEDHHIVQFVLEELAPYYAGDRTLDDAITVLNDRVTRYVREM
ncbi:MAG: extracellular solute-binding protein [Clostridiales bacterium]|nr:extracellular solute-binding protein [Clostridiales bacterium]